jgi:hypothetical protein
LVERPAPLCEAEAEAEGEDAFDPEPEPEAEAAAALMIVVDLPVDAEAVPDGAEEATAAPAAALWKVSSGSVMLYGTMPRGGRDAEEGTHNPRRR